MQRISLFIVTVLALGAMTVAPTVASGHRHGSSSHGRHRRGRPQEVSGTIASLRNGVLTITRSDNSTVSGQVTSATEIECEHPENQPADNAAGQPTATKADHGSGDSSDGSGSGDEGNSNTQSTTPQSGTGRDEANDNEANDNEANENEANEANENEANEPNENEGAEDQGENTQPQSGVSNDQNAAQSPCDMSALKQGVVVTRARLRDSGTQLVFKQIKLAV